MTNVVSIFLLRLPTLRPPKHSWLLDSYLFAVGKRNIFRSRPFLTLHSILQLAAALLRVLIHVLFFDVAPP